MKTLNFGIEMEMTGITRRMAAKVMSTVLGTNTYKNTHEVDGYCTWSAFGADGRKWKAMRDVSISAEKRDSDGDRVYASDEYQTEIVSPICTYEDIPMIQEIVRQLKKAGALVNRSCGIHIHVGAERFDAKHLCVLVNMMGTHQDLFTMAVKTQAARMHQYCKKLSADFIEKLKAEKPTDIKKLLTIWYNGADPDGYYQTYHYNNTRYHVLNLHAYNTKGTVEYRLFESSLHAGKVKAWIQICLALTAKALNTTRMYNKPIDMSNPAYAGWCWLRQLGLQGDEFETARFHFLHELTGSMRYRNISTVQRRRIPGRRGHINQTEQQPA